MQSQNVKELELKIRLLYPLWIIIAIFSVAYIPSVIFVQGDSALTVTHVEENALLFRVSIVGSIATQVLHAYIPFYLYLLFESINKNRARLMLILALISIPLTMGFDLFKLAALADLSSESVYTFLSLAQNGLIISSILWGLWLFPLGRLVLESTYFPKAFGYILFVACIGYIFGSLIKIVFPSATSLLAVSEAFTFGEVLFALWVIIKGVRINS